MALESINAMDDTSTASQPAIFGRRGMPLILPSLVSPANVHWQVTAFAPPSAATRLPAGGLTLLADPAREPADAGVANEAAPHPSSSTESGGSKRSVPRGAQHERA